MLFLSICYISLFNFFWSNNDSTNTFSSLFFFCVCKLWGKKGANRLNCIIGSNLCFENNCSYHPVLVKKCKGCFMIKKNASYKRIKCLKILKEQIGKVIIVHEWMRRRMIMRNWDGHMAHYIISQKKLFFNIILFWLFVGVGALVRYKLPKKWCWWW